MYITIRPFRDGDATEASIAICQSLREVNAKDYPAEEIERLVSCFTSDALISFSQEREMFVAEMGGAAIGIASLARDNRTDAEEYVCLTVFVHPDWHGQGIGKKLMDRIEETARLKDVAHLRLPASFTALPFYRKIGYSEDPQYPFNPAEGVVWMMKVL